jgi:hypothetical protein
LNPHGCCLCFFERTVQCAFSLLLLLLLLLLQKKDAESFGCCWRRKRELKRETQRGS